MQTDEHESRMKTESAESGRSVIREFYFQQLKMGCLHAKWKRKYAGNICLKGLKIESGLLDAKDKKKVIEEFIDIIRKICDAQSEKEATDFIVNSILTIDASISNNYLRKEFREKIFDDFFKVMEIDIINPAKGESFKPDLHSIVGGEGILGKIRSVEAIGTKKRNGEVIKKAAVTLD